MEELRHCSGPAAASPADLYGDVYALEGKNPCPRELPEPDVYILTTGGHRIPAHSGILVIDLSQNQTPRRTSVAFDSRSPDFFFLFLGFFYFCFGFTVGFSVAGAREHHRQPSTEATKLWEAHPHDRRPQRRRCRVCPLHLLLQVSDNLTLLSNDVSVSNSKFSFSKFICST